MKTTGAGTEDTTPVSIAAAADEIGKTPRTILKWIHDGKIQARKLGPGTAAYVITRSELDRIKQDAA